MGERLPSGKHGLHGDVGLRAEPVTGSRVRVLGGPCLGAAAGPADVPPGSRRLLAYLAVDPGAIAGLELLPGWYDEWVLIAGTRLRLRLLHALDASSRLLRAAGRRGGGGGRARGGGGRAPAAERSARAHRGAPGEAAGDWVAARRRYDAFQGLLRREVRVEPSPELTAAATRPR